MGTRKHREIHFASADTDQMRRAGVMLDGLEDLDVAQGPTPNRLSLSYDLRQYTLQGIERALIQQGYVLRTGLIWRISRALLYFSEETQLRNLRMPERLLKKSHEIYSRAWDHHPHGDHDDTPPDLRQDR